MADMLTPTQLAAPFRTPAIYELNRALQMGCGKPIWHTGTCTRYHMCHRCQAIKSQLSYYCLLRLIANLNERHQEALREYEALYEAYEQLRQAHMEHS